MKITKLTTILLLGATAVGLSSCRHKDLYMDEAMTSQLQIVFDWRDAPDATPESMALYLYDSSGHTPLRYIFDNRFGGEIKAPLGIHHSICLNADNTDWARMRKSEEIGGLEIYTQDALDLREQDIRSASIPRARGSESERIALTPSMLWGKRTNNIVIAPHSGMQTITLYPQEVTYHYMVDVYDVDNLDGVVSSSVDATLSGMAEGYCYGAQSSTDNPVTMSFSLTSDTSAGSLHGEFLTFGECPNTSASHHLTIYMVLSDGSRWWKSFDVTDQVTNAADPTHVHIIVRGLPLPEPPSGGSAVLKPNVNDWQEVNIGLQM